MNDILDFKEEVEKKHGHFIRVILNVTIEEKNIVIQVPITFLSDYSGMSLSIMWETAGLSHYKDLGLLDQYVATWDNMTFSEESKSLKIRDKDGLELVVSV